MQNIKLFFEIQTMFITFNKPKTKAHHSYDYLHQKTVGFLLETNGFKKQKTRRREFESLTFWSVVRRSIQLS